MSTVSFTSHVHKTSNPVQDREFDKFSATFTKNFEILTQGECTLVMTEATGLFDTFLRGLPLDQRGHYDCRECRKFVDRFGGLKVILPTGHETTIWDFKVPGVHSFDDALNSLKAKVSRAKIDTAFVSPSLQWGTKKNYVERGPWKGTTWTHLNLTPPGKFSYYSPVKNSEQRAAELKEDFGMLKRGLDEFSLETAKQAVHLLLSGGLDRADKAIHIAKWFVTLHENLVGISRNHRRRDNLIWYAVSKAPVGFAHIKGSMIGTLLEDIQEGKHFEAIKAAWNKKMDPLKYLRPQAPPKAGTLVQANKLVEELESAGAFKRRFARLEDVAHRAIWLPKTFKKEVLPADSLFSAVRARPGKLPESNLMPIPGYALMTWVKFRDTVLPNAAKIEYLPHWGTQNFVGMLTAADPTAPPILRWDKEDDRNPVSLYMYALGSNAGDWGLRAASKVQVNAIMTRPGEWTTPDRSDAGMVFVLEGAVDRKGPGLALFPETLKSEYHGVRAAIEALNATRQPTGIGSANGIFFSEKAPWVGAKFTVTNRDGTSRDYQIDRWD